MFLLRGRNQTTLNRLGFNSRNRSVKCLNHKDYNYLSSQEHLAEVALKEELLRQEKLEQLAYKFERKSVLREGYLNEMIAVLSDPRQEISKSKELFISIFV